MKKKIIAIIGALALCFSAYGVCLAYGIDITPTAIGALDGGVKTILGTAQWIGFIVAVAMCIYVGVKYVSKGAGGKAEVKSDIIPMLVGAALIALAPVIANAVFTMFDNNSGEASQSTVKELPKKDNTGDDDAKAVIKDDDFEDFYWHMP